MKLDRLIRKTTTTKNIFFLICFYFLKPILWDDVSWEVIQIKKLLLDQQGLSHIFPPFILVFFELETLRLWKALKPFTRSQRFLAFLEWKMVTKAICFSRDRQSCSQSAKREGWSVFSSCHLHHRPSDTGSMEGFDSSYFRLDKKKGKSLKTVNPPRNTNHCRKSHKLSITSGLITCWDWRGMCEKWVFKKSNQQKTKCSRNNLEASACKENEKPVSGSTDEETSAPMGDPQCIPRPEISFIHRVCTRT